jgi:hypothetical protein
VFGLNPRLSPGGEESFESSVPEPSDRHA